MTRAKFYLVSKKEMQSSGSSNLYELEFRPVMSGSEENKSFYAFTPGGVLTLSVVNKGTADQFEVGLEYYLDLTLATVKAG